MTTDRRWWSGKVAGFSTIAGLIVGVVALVALEVQTGWVDRRWKETWPAGQFGALGLVVLILLGALVRLRNTHDGS